MSVFFLLLLLIVAPLHIRLLPSGGCQNEMSTIVNQFILRRTNTINAQHLPDKLVQVVCCKLTDIQRDIYRHLLHNKDLMVLRSTPRAFTCLCLISRGGADDRGTAAECHISGSIFHFSLLRFVPLDPHR